VRQGRGIAFGDTRRKSAPFRDGHRPIRPITGRPSLSPASSTPWPVPLPRGRDTALAGRGPWGLPSWSRPRCVVGRLGSIARWDIRVLPSAKAGPTVRPTSPFGCGLSASLAASEW